MNNTALQNTQSYNSQAKTWDETLGKNVWYKYLERPAMKSLLPDNLERKDVLCIGVGTGDELGEIIKQNPKRVVCIDISEEFLKIAQEKYPSIESQCVDMMEMAFPDNSFDLIYSSLAFHYASDWDVLMQKISKALKPQGSLLFSTHHPETWKSKEKIGEVVNERGITQTMHKTVLHAGVEVIYYNHKNTEEILESIRRVGLEILTEMTPKPLEDISVPKWEQDEYLNLVERMKTTPLFYVVLAKKI